MAAILGSVSLTSHETRQALITASAIVLAISLVITAASKIVRLERVWYEGRAIAESVKSLAWRYMTCTEPYSQNLGDRAADIKFGEDMSSILLERRGFHWRGGAAASGTQITGTMRQSRALDVEDRKRLYLSNRINEQRNWYSVKATRNSRAASRIFVATILSQALALIAALILVQHPEAVLNPIGIFVAMAAAIIAWSQLKQYQELAQSYGITVQELGIICDRSRHISSNEEFSRFVSDSENAISREHTLWLARRDSR